MRVTLFPADWHHDRRSCFKMFGRSVGFSPMKGHGGFLTRPFPSFDALVTCSCLSSIATTFLGDEYYVLGRPDLRIDIMAHLSTFPEIRNFQPYEE